MRLFKFKALSILFSLLLISCAGTGNEPATPVDAGQDAGASGGDSDGGIESDAENDSDAGDVGASGSDSDTGGDRDVGPESDAENDSDLEDSGASEDGNDAGSDDAELDDDAICECDEETPCCDGCNPINVGEECGDENLFCTDSTCTETGVCEQTVLDGWCLTGNGTAEEPWQCADTATDPANCGTCDHICPQGAVCIAGDCFMGVTGITVKPKILSLPVGDQHTLTASITPVNATDKRITWTSKDETVATVDEDGTVTALGQGVANIIVTTVDGEFSASAAITVVVPVTGVTLSPESLTLILGKSKRLSATIIPAEATVKTVVWESTDPGVAPVDKGGWVVGMGMGETTVTVRTEDGNYTDSIEVSVTPPTGYELIQAGSFTMGSPEGELGRENDETQHEVIITRPFLMKATQVTQGEWEDLISSNPSRFRKCGSDCPVEYIDWHMTLNYANALSESEWLPQCFDCIKISDRFVCGLKEKYAKPQDCLGYRLPTEAEWEYAARAGSTTAFHTGPITDTEACSNMDRAGWYENNSGEKTHSVGGKEPNDWGLYDMHGNVWEWVWDWYGDYGDGSVTDPYGPSTGSNRGLRGGSWNSGAGNCRAGNRACDIPDGVSRTYGFRLARTL